MPSKVYLDLPQHDGDFRAMPAYLAGPVAGIKWVNSHPRSPERYGLPAVLATYVLSDPTNGVPLAVLDGTHLTAARTGAAAAVASKHLARKDVRSIGFVGCGVQARTMLAAHREVFSGSRSDRLRRERGRGDRFCEGKRRPRGIGGRGVGM